MRFDISLAAVVISSVLSLTSGSSNRAGGHGRRLVGQSSLEARRAPTLVRTCPANTRRDGPNLNGPNCVDGSDGQCCPVYGVDNFCYHKACLAVAGHPEPTYKQCGSCPIKGSYPDSTGHCVCPPGQSVYKGRCVTPAPPKPKCPSDATLSKAGKCICPDGTNYDAEKNSCIPITCPQGQQLGGAPKHCVNICGTAQTYDPETNRCTCPSGQYVSGSTCKPICTSPQTYNPDTQSCYCPYSQKISGHKCAPICGPEQTYQDDGSCSCPTGFTVKGLKCVPKCKAPQHYDSETSSCQCPYAQTVSGSGCTPTCGPKQTFSAGQCTCPGGTTISGKECVPNCPAGQHSSPEGPCVCDNSQQIIYNGSCTNVPNCRAKGYTYESSSNSCKCADGYQLNDANRCVPNCPVDKSTFDGSSCCRAEDYYNDMCNEPSPVPTGGFCDNQHACPTFQICIIIPGVLNVYATGICQ